MNTTHSKYSPSKLGRILSCTASALVEGADSSSSSYADRGTRLHEVIEKAVSAYLKDENYEQHLLHLDPTDRVEVEDALDYFFGLLTPEMTVHLEQHVCIAPDCSGTADLVLVGNGAVHICDYKFGSVEVSAIGNPQLMAYAAGVCNMLNLYSGNVYLHIIQPKIKNYSEDITTVTNIYEWRDTILLPTLGKINSGKVEYVPNVGNCRWCPIKTTCMHRIDKAFKDAEEVFAEFRELPTLPTDKYADLISKAKEVEQVIKDVEAQALVNLKKGEPVKGLKLVHGRSSRSWKDEEQVAGFLGRYLREDQIYTKKMLSPAQAEKVVPKALRKDDSFLSLVDKKQGKLTVAPESDKRQAVTDPTGAVFENFKEV